MKKTLSLAPRMPLGVITPGQLRRLADAVDRFGIPVIRATAGQRIMLSGIRPEDMDDLRSFLGPCGEAMKHYVQACPGQPVCSFGLADSLALGRELESLLAELGLPAKVKAGISACPRSCGESLVRDIGLVGRSSGWTLYFGGNAGMKPRVGDLLAGRLTQQEALLLSRRVLEWYAGEAGPKERTAPFMERVGVARLLAELGLEAPGGQADGPG